jgi:hypothetical protein
MLPRYRLDFTRDAADQMAYVELANDGDAIHRLTNGVVPFAISAAGSHFGGDNSTRRNFWRPHFFAGFCWQDSSIAGKPNATSGGEFLD